jgi:hypothetical protein
VSYKYRELSLKERGQLLIIVLIAILIGAIFFGTVFLVDRIFPGTALSGGFWYIDATQKLSPGAGVFASLAMLCAIIAVTLFATAIFSDLALLYLPLALISLAEAVLFLVNLIGAFMDIGFWYGMGVLGLFAAEAGPITWGLIKLAGWYDRYFGERPFFRNYQGIYRGENDPYLDDGIDKYL